MGVDSPRVPEAAQPEKVLVGAPDKERPDARAEVCGFCRAPLDEFAEYARDPWDSQMKWLCSDATACAERGRKH